MTTTIMLGDKIYDIDVPTTPSSEQAEASLSRLKAGQLIPHDVDILACYVMRMEAGLTLLTAIHEERIADEQPELFAAVIEEFVPNTLSSLQMNVSTLKH